MDADKYNREKIISDLAEIKSPHQKIEFLSKLKIDFLESTNEADRLKDQFSQLTKGLGYCIKFDQWCDNKINDQIEILKTKNSNMASKESDLSAFEIALKHYYLYLAKKENLSSKEISEMYHGVKNKTNIVLAYNKLFKADSKKGNKSQLKKVNDSLNEYPDIQRAIQNDIDKLN